MCEQEIKGYFNFNSHAHVERDKYQNRQNVAIKISTHTLTWSVTGKDNAEDNNAEYFNSHAHVERD